MDVILGQNFGSQVRKRLPLGRSFEAKNFDLFAKYKQLSSGKQYHVLLESGRDGHYSIIGLDPWAILSGKNNELTITVGHEVAIKKGPLLLAMKQWMDNYKTEIDETLPEFQGGAVGFLSYDLIRQIEKIPTQSRDDLETEDLFFLVFDDVFIFDHKNERFWVITHYKEGEKEIAEERLVALEKQWLNEPEKNVWQYEKEQKDEQYWEASLSEVEFKKAVTKVQDYIAAGDVFQVNLSVRQTKKLQTDPLHIYEKLRQINPSPYMSSPAFRFSFIFLKYR